MADDTFDATLGGAQPPDAMSKPGRTSPRRRSQSRLSPHLLAMQRSAVERMQTRIQDRTAQEMGLPSSCANKQMRALMSASSPWRDDNEGASSVRASPVLDTVPGAARAMTAPAVSTESLEMGRHDNMEIDVEVTDLTEELNEEVQYGMFTANLVRRSKGQTLGMDVSLDEPGEFWIIRRLHPGSPAALPGILRENDRILSINGRPAGTDVNLATLIPTPVLFFHVEVERVPPPPSPAPPPAPEPNDAPDADADADAVTTLDAAVAAPSPAPVAPIEDAPPPPPQPRNVSDLYVQRDEAATRVQALVRGRGDRHGRKRAPTQAELPDLMTNASTIIAAADADGNVNDGEAADGGGAPAEPAEPAAPEAPAALADPAAPAPSTSGEALAIGDTELAPSVAAKAKPMSANEVAAMQLLVLMRDTRERSLGVRGAFSNPVAAHTLQSSLPDIIAALRTAADGTADITKVGAAMRKLADGVARVAKSEEAALVDVLHSSGALAAVVLSCSALPLDDELSQPLVSGLIVLGNASFMGGAALVADVGGVELTVRLLCADAIVPLKVRRVAAVALHHLLAGERRALRMIRASDRAPLLKALDALTDDPASFEYAKKAIRALRSVRGPGGNVFSTRAQREAAEAREQADIRRRQSEALERANLRAQLAYKWAAVRLQERLRLRRDARRGAEELDRQRDAAQILQKLYRGHTIRIAKKLKRNLLRPHASSAASGPPTDEAAAEQPDDSASELLLDAFQLPDADDGPDAGDDGTRFSRASPSADLKGTKEKRGSFKIKPTPKRRARWQRLCSCFSKAKATPIDMFGLTADGLSKSLPVKLSQPKMLSFDKVGPASISQTVSWGGKWMRANYAKEYRRCIVYVIFIAVYEGMRPLVMEQLFGVVLPHFMAGQSMCIIDLSLFSGILLLGALMVLVIQYEFNVLKMDGSGFVPLMQKQLVLHTCRLPQTSLDGLNETQIISMLDKDVNALNAVISSYFELMASFLGLCVLVPVLYILSPELVCIVLLSIPVFVYNQLRVAGFIIRQSEHLRAEEAGFMISVEESIIYATTNKLLGLDKTLGVRLHNRFRSMCDAYDTLDLCEAKSDFQLAAFNMLMRVGIVAGGIALIFIPKKEGDIEVSPGLGDECFIMNATLLQDTSELGDLGGRISITTLFAFLSGSEAIEPLCISIITCMRKFQTGSASVNRVKAFFGMPADPWPAAARAQKNQLKLEAAAMGGLDKLRQHGKIAAFLKKSRARAGLHEADTTLSVTNSDKRRVFGIMFSEDDQPKIVSLAAGGLGAICGLSVGDKVLAINGQFLDGGCAQADRLLYRPLGRFEFKVKRGWSSTGKDTSGGEDSWDDARTVAAFTSVGERVGLMINWNRAKDAVVISEIIDKSPFYATLRIGDELLAINGMPLVRARKEVDVKGGKSRDAYLKSIIRKAMDDLKATEGKLTLRVRTPGLLNVGGRDVMDDATRERKEREKMRQQAAAIAVKVAKMDLAQQQATHAPPPVTVPASAPASAPVAAPADALAAAPAISPASAPAPASQSTSLAAALVPTPEEAPAPAPEATPAEAPAAEQAAEQAAGHAAAPEPSVQFDESAALEIAKTQLQDALSPKNKSKKPKEAVRLNDCTLAYGGRTVLSNVDLVVPVGAKMVLYGRSGSGKSTLLKLISRLYQPAEGGTVQIFEKPVNDICVDDVMTYMEQKQIMFEGTIGENLRIGLGEEIDSDKAKDEALKTACLDASAWADMQAISTGDSLKHGVGFRGKLINTGLCQRLNLARCLLRDKPLLLLDEPMSAQDSVTAKQVGEMLQKAKVKGEDGDAVPLTVVMISHKTSVAEQCTHAAVVNNGRIVESGEIRKLLKRKGHLYRQLAAASGLSVDAKGRAQVTGDRLRQIWMFSNAPFLSLQDLSKSFRTRHCRIGETLYEQNEEANLMWIVVSGQIEQISTVVDADQPSAGDGKDSGFGTSQREVFQHGDALGVSALVDDTWNYPGAATISSSKAVLLELHRDDLEELLAKDSQLQESVGELRNVISLARSPQRLAQLWPFFGMSLGDLEAIGDAVEPMIFDAETSLFDAPRDPCAALSLIVFGTIGVITSSNGEPTGFQKLGRGDAFGENAVLPPQKPGSAEELILAKQDGLVRGKATDFSVVLQITQFKLQQLAVRFPGIEDNISGNLRSWIDGVRPQMLATADWLFGCCPPEVLAALAVQWKPAILSEGEVAVDQHRFRGRCAIVVRGSVLVKTTHLRDDELFTVEEIVGEGGIINSLGLLTPEDPVNDYMVEVTYAEATTSTFVIEMRPETFRKVLLHGDKQNLRGQLPWSSRLHNFAKDRARLLSPGGMRAMRALPSLVVDEEMKMLLLARSAALNGMRVVARGATFLEATREARAQRDAIQPSQSPQPTSRSSVPSTAPAARVMPSSGRRMTNHDLKTFASINWGVAAIVAKVISGELQAERVDGTAITLKEGDTFSTPLPAELGELALDTTECIIRAWCEGGASQEPPCVLMVYEMQDLVHAILAERARLEQLRLEEEAAMEAARIAQAAADAMDAVEREKLEAAAAEARKKAELAAQEQRRIAQAEAERSESQRLREQERILGAHAKVLKVAQKKREMLQLKIASVRNKTASLEMRLSLRARREPAALWLVALRRLRAFRALGIDPYQTSAMSAGTRGGGRGGSGRDTELSTLEETLTMLQKRRNHLEKVLTECSARLNTIIKRWEALQPLLPNESSLSLDTEGYDLSQARLAEAQTTIDTLVRKRERFKSKILRELRDYWAQLSTPTTEQHAILERAKDIDAASLNLLQETLAGKRYTALSPMMIATQSELNTFWLDLQLPADQRLPFQWAEGQPLTEAHLKRCQAEVTRLDGWSSQLAPVLARVAQSPEQRQIVNEVLHSLHQAFVQDDQLGGGGGDEDEDHAPEVGSGGSGGGADVDEVRRRSAEQLNALKASHAKQLARMQAQADTHDGSSVLRREMEAEQRAANYGEATFHLQELLVLGQRLLGRVLCASDAVMDEYDSIHGDVHLVSPKLATSAQLQEVSARVKALDEVIERLQSRAESDGIFCAIVGLANRNSWPQDAVNLAKRILEFSTDVNQFALQRRRSYEAAQQGAKDPPISYYQLTGFLQNNEIEFTEEGMAYLLQAVGTSTSAVERGANLETERFTRALREYLREPTQIVVRSLATN